nr:hypothetical protein [Tanacetum cinerariifolium]
SYHKLFDILKQYQNEVNELCAERLARNANPQALVAAAQADQDLYYQTSRHKCKEIAKPITPPSETTSEEDSDPEQAQRDKDMQKNLALIVKYFKKIYKPTNNNLRTSSNSKNKNVDMTPRFKNDNHSGQFGKQRTVNVAGARKKVGSPPKRVKDSAYHKEKMLLCKVRLVPQGEIHLVILTDRLCLLLQLLIQLEAHYSYMAKIQEVPTADSGTNSEPVEQVKNDAGYNVFTNELQHSEQSEYVSNTCLVETDDSNVIPDSPNMCEDDIQNDQNDVESDDEHVALASLIANLKLDFDENKKIQKKLKKANTTLSQELKECKSILAETSKSLWESISVRTFNDRTIDYDKLERRPILRYGDLVQRNVTINRVYYVEGLNYNLFSVGQFCDADLERKKRTDQILAPLPGRDGENLDKIKEKGDSCMLVGYSTKSKGYCVYNKRIRLIVESIHICFDEIKEVSETSVADNTSSLVPQRQKASDYDNPNPVP